MDGLISGVVTIIAAMAALAFKRPRAWTKLNRIAVRLAPVVFLAGGAAVGITVARIFPEEAPDIRRIGFLVFYCSLGLWLVASVLDWIRKQDKGGDQPN